MDDVIIRRAAESDAVSIGELWEKLVAFHHQLDQQLPVAAEDGGSLYARFISDKLDSSHTHILVAEHNGRIVGFTVGVIVDMVPDMFHQTTGGYLTDIFIEDAYRGSGIGRRIVDQLTDWFRSRGVDYFEWYVAANNPAGQAFWRTLGGREIMVRMRIEL